VSAARFDRIRLFKVARTVAEKPQEDCKGSWRRCSPASIPDFSAVAYFFGRHLHRELGVPIGLIQSAWGGTPAEAWTSTEALAGTPELAPILERWRKILAGYPEARRRHEQRLAAWKKAPRAKRGRRPRPPRGPRHQHRPSGLYQGMIHPLTRLRTRGVIWYQGEANASRAYQYRTLFPLMIRDWRRAFGQDRLPFLFVQLANFKLRRGDGRSWAELREAQLMTLAFPDTAMAVTIDIGNPADIHPKNKQEVGRRLALAALARVHGRELVFSGPIYRSHRQSGNTIVLEFDHVHGGLATRGSPVLEGFEIAGADRKFHPAKARIRGDRVLVRSDKVGKPVAVRYAWADNPVCNLVNEAELPASPFRTDDWPGVTREAR
ncbi:MAG: sialate O-acetylesterase, partial [Planctomycetota bacterium]